ncbi:MAG: alanyl-tRNA editing protein [Calditrichaeota bacterium]|nr:alanyl-tRNA editing protein [Calditrichota bacterium]
MNKKYYEDQGLTALETTVEDIRILNDKKWYAFKDSIIYPGGGGQIPDKAKINGYEIAGVYKDDDFTGFRFNENCSFDTGDSVKIEIDADFRQYNRQQHTAQHLISAVMDDLGFKTVSVHLGEEYTLIEIEGGIPDNEKIRFIENRSNEIIHQALPVKCEWLSTDEAQKLPLRKKPGLYDALRIVSIDGIDYSACGGTHVDNTSQIGLIKFINLEKIRGNARLQFFVGKKAYEYFSQVHEMERKLVNILQTAPEQLEQRIQNLIADKTALTKSLANLKKKWLPYEAESILKGRKKWPIFYQKLKNFQNKRGLWERDFLTVRKNLFC